MTDFEFDESILKEFTSEIRESLDGLDSLFVELEKNPLDKAIINEIFRSAHSIKGGAAFFNLNDVKNFAHKLENLLDNLRKDKMPTTSDVISVLLKGTDHLKNMINRVAGGDLVCKLTDDENTFLASLEDYLDPSKKQKKEGPSISDVIELFYIMDSLMLDVGRIDGVGANPTFLEFAEYYKQLKKLMSHSTSQEVKSQTTMLHLGEILLEQGLIDEEDLEDALKSQGGKKVGEVLVEVGKVSESDVNRALEIQKGGAPAPAEAQAKATAAAEKKASKTMRIEEGRVDDFMKYVGELIISGEVFNYLQKKLENRYDIDKLIMEFKNANVAFGELSVKLQHGLLDIRKVPIKGLMQRMPRMVRDLSGTLGKEVEVMLHGEEVDIDKSLLEQLESPMIHLVRNAVDHGIEMPDEREKTGKPRKGTVHIKASSDSESLYIEIVDNGKGMDPRILGEKAIQKGLLTPEQVMRMTDEERLNIIFLPGFSTKQEITDVSGRGVGMDVVMDTVKKQKGSVTIDSNLGKGSKFLIRLPMSMTLITVNGLIVQVGTQRYIVPVEHVKESLRPTREQLTSVVERGEVVNIRGTLYPIVRLYELFGIKSDFTDPCEAVVMVIHCESEKFCLLVDNILGQQQVVLKDLGEDFKHLVSLAGGAIFGDGTVGLVLNVSGITKAAFQS